MTTTIVPIHGPEDDGFEDDDFPDGCEVCGFVRKLNGDQDQRCDCQPEDE